MTDKESIARFRVIFDLHEAGVALMRENIRRGDPVLPPQEIELRLSRWLARPEVPPPESGLVLRPARLMNGA